MPLDGEKKTISIFFKVIIDSSLSGENSKDVIEKETDTHMFSSDGFGEFNYR